MNLPENALGVALAIVVAVMLAFAFGFILIGLHR